VSELSTRCAILSAESPGTYLCVSVEEKVVWAKTETESLLQLSMMDLDMWIMFPVYLFQKQPKKIFVYREL